MNEFMKDFTSDVSPEFLVFLVMLFYIFTAPLVGGFFPSIFGIYIASPLLLYMAYVLYITYKDIT